MSYLIFLFSLTIFSFDLNFQLLWKFIALTVKNIYNDTTLTNLKNNWNVINIYIGIICM